MKDAARFALAIAAILSATALDAQQRSASQGSYATAYGTVAVRSGQPDHVPPPKPASLDELDRDGDGSISASETAANDALTSEFDHADENADGRISDVEFDRWIANATVP